MRKTLLAFSVLALLALWATAFGQAPKDTIPGFVNFSGSLLGDVTGTQAATVVGKIGGMAISLANSFTTSGNFGLTLTTTNTTNATIPAGTITLTKSAAATQTDVTASRALGSTYHNTGTVPLLVEVWANTAGSGACYIYVASDSASTPGTNITGNTSNAGAGFPLGVTFLVMPGNYYKISQSNATLVAWIETTIGTSN